MPKALIIGVVGGNQPTDQEAAWAEEVGRGIARNGAVLVTGGMGGAMEAASKGAAEEGGLVVGVLPGSFRSAANPYVTIPIVTGMSYARNIVVVKTAMSVIAVGGKYGTLSEIAHALGEGIPVVGLGTWELGRNGALDGAIHRAAGPEDAVCKALELAEQRAWEESRL